MEIKGNTRNFTSTHRRLPLTSGMIPALGLSLVLLVLLPVQAVSQGGAPKHCHGVSFDALFYPVVDDVFFATAEIVDGDLEGWADVELLGSTPPPGKGRSPTNTATFLWHWNITGGVIPELVGGSFVTIISNRNLLGIPPRANDPPFASAVGKHRAVSGVHKANLTYIPGEAVPTEIPDTFFENLLAHHGVICP